MKKLFTPKSGTVGYILGHALIGGKQFRLVSADSTEISNLAEAGKIVSLDYEFPDTAEHVEYQRYLRDNKGDVRKAAELYLADLLSGKSKNPADVAAENASDTKGAVKAETKPTGKVTPAPEKTETTPTPEKTATK